MDTAIAAIAAVAAVDRFACRASVRLQLVEFRALYFGELPIALPLIVKDDDARVVGADTLGWLG
jgi:hypothetical protein